MIASKTVLIASDHAGVDVKRFLSDYAEELGFTVDDLGVHDTQPTDYPAIGHGLAREVVSRGVWGILVCGSGIGMSIAANKVVGARAALVHDAYTARMARQHNDANIVVVGARVLGPDLLKECVRVFSETAFTPGANGRHLRRVQHLEV